MTYTQAYTRAKPTFLSTFAGIGGFDLGLERAGWQCVGQVEIDPFCQKVLARRWPATARHNDIRTFDGLVDPVARDGRGDAGLWHEGRGPAGQTTSDPHHPDLITGGFPCQDLSVAGKRAGLAGSRSGLFFDFVRVATRLRPAWILLENVPGLLSSNHGRDFGLVLAELGDAGYGVGWRVLDSQWFGVAQRRRRVFIVGRLGEPCPFEVLFDSESSSGDSPASYPPREDLAGTLGSGPPGARGYRNDLDTSGAFVARPLTATAFKHHDPDTDTLVFRKAARAQSVTDSESWVEDRIANTINPFDQGDVRTTQTVVQDGVRRLTPTENERLQGFPDGWTCLCGVSPYSTEQCNCPDGKRYAALGNAVTVPVIQWLGERLLKVATA